MKDETDDHKELDARVYRALGYQDDYYGDDKDSRLFRWIKSLKDILARMLPQFIKRG